MEFLNLDLGMPAGGGDMAHMSLENDMVVEPRMNLSLYSLENEKADSPPSQLVMTPRMFDSDSVSYTSELQAATSDESVSDTVDTIKVPFVVTPETEMSLPPTASPETPWSNAREQMAATPAKFPESHLPPPFSASSPSSPPNARRRRSQPRCDVRAAPVRLRSAWSRSASSIDTVRSRCLERNRIAAFKCRQKKKQKMDELMNTRDELGCKHNSLKKECDGLQAEASSIKTALMAHAGCSDSNIDRWLANSAVRFVQRSSAAAGISRLPSIGSLEALLGRGDKWCPSAMATLESPVAARRFYADGSSCAVSSAQTFRILADGTHVSASPGPKAQHINYDYMPDEMFQDGG